MNLKKIVYEFRLKNTQKKLRTNAEKIKYCVENGLNYNEFYREQLRLMACKSYFENKLSLY